MSKKIDKHSNPNRVEIERHSNKVVKSKISYENDKKHGVSTGWHEDGTKYFENMWIDGKEHGLAKGWYRDGVKVYQMPFREGKTHGMETGWWENSQKEVEKTWRLGKPQGMTTAWRKGGSKRQETYFLNLEIYACIEWDEYGNVTEIYIHPTIQLQSQQKQSPNQEKIISKNR